MRRARFKAEASVQVAHYHCVSRVVDRNFVLGELEKETFIKLMRRYETYCGVRVLSFCVMTNHFHTTSGKQGLGGRGAQGAIFRTHVGC